MKSEVSFTASVENWRNVGDAVLQASSPKILEGNFELNSDIGIILPTYCEAANIKQIINEIENLNLKVSIMVIDDSSPDGTANIVRALQRKYDNILLLIRPEKSGLGTAITDGMKIFLSMENPPKYVITMDADYSHNPKDIPRLVKVAKKGYDLVIGSRYFPGGKITDWSPVRIMISKVANKFASVIIGAKIKDCTSGLRCYSLNMLKKVIGELHSQTYEIQIETIRQAVKKGCYITEMPIVFTNRKLGKSKLTLNEIKQFVSYIGKANFEDYLGIPRYIFYGNVEFSNEILIEFFNAHVHTRLREA